MGYFNGTWTEETRDIADALGVGVENVITVPYYTELGPDWVCPGCGRSKIETIRKLPGSGKLNFRFVAHHDHMLDEINASRFDWTIVCEDCNNLDNALKVAIRGKVAKWEGMPRNGVYSSFSFSAEELLSICGHRESNTITRLSDHHIDAALEIYNRHFRYGLEAFKQHVRNEQDKRQKNLEVSLSPHKAPFLLRFGISERSVSHAGPCIVDGPRKKRSFISEYRRDGICVLGIS